ncbi:unnamed protein product [Durusdinium trenchii]|uniref:Uncharacterized protein n=1 Tax=Durusdinium trenchii TaxID=1381693 RepID=A0ABP0L7S4_9DINO
MSAEKKRRLDALLPVFEELEVCEAIWTWRIGVASFVSAESKRRLAMELHWRPPVGHRVGPVELADGVREDEVEEEICHFAQRLRLAAPANFPLDARTGLPAAHHLPKGFTLPWPSLEEEMPKAMALASGLKRVPPPQALLERSSGVPGAAWAVQLRPIAPASAVLFTVDGSLPRVGSASTMRASEAPVLLAEGGQVFAVAAAPGKHLSDVVTVKTPMAKAGVELMKSGVKKTFLHVA